MSTYHDGETRALRLVASGFALLTLAVGLICLSGWLLAIPKLASFGSVYKPMAPVSTILFTLAGASAFLCARAPERRYVKRFSVAVGLITGILGTTLCVSSSLGVYVAIERLGLTGVSTIDGARVGHMSPVTALYFSIAGLLMLMSHGLAPEHKNRTMASFVFAVLLVLGGFTLFLAYMVGWPLFRHSVIIPPALPTGLAFMMLGFALGALARIRIIPGDEVIHGSGIVVSYMLVGVYLVLAFGIITSGYLHYRRTEAQQRFRVEEQLRTIADLKVDDIGRWRNERIGNARVISRNRAFYELAEQAFTGSGDSVARNRLQAWLDQIREAYAYESVALINTDGSEHVFSQQKEAPVTPFVLQCVRQTVIAGDVVFHDFHRDGEGLPVHLSVMTPILGEQTAEAARYVLVLRIDPREYLYPFMSRWPAPSTTAETLLVRRDGEDVLFLNALRFKPDAALTLRRPLREVGLPAVQAVLGHEGIVEGVDYRGVPVLAAVRSIPESPWGLVARMDLDEVYALMKARFSESLLLVSVLLLCAAASVALVWRQQRTHFYKARYILERERAWLQEVISRSLNEVYVFDSTTLRFTFANEGACRNLGYTAEELVAMTPVDLKPEFTPESFAEKVLPLRQGDCEMLVFRTRHQRKDGSTYPAEVHMQYLEASGKPVFLALINDITERCRAEDAVKRLNRLYAVLSGINEAIVRVHDREALFQQACDIAHEKGAFPLVWIGLTDAESGALRPVASAGPSNGLLERLNISLEGPPRAECPVDTALRQNRSVVCSAATGDIRSAACLSAVHHLGLQSCAIFPLRVFGKSFGVVAFYARERDFFDEDELKLLEELSSDISFAMEFLEKEAARKEAEVAQRNTEERYRKLTELSPMAIFVNRNGRIEFANPACLALIGASTPDQILGKTPCDIFHPDFHEKLQEHIQILTEERRSVPLAEEKIVCLDGSSRDVEVAASPFTDHRGNAIQVVMNDITDRKHLEAQLNHVRKMEAVGQLAGGVAHDFNNILQAVMGGTQLLLDDATVTREQRELLTEIQTGAERAATLTRQLLAYSRRQVIRPEVIDLNHAITDFLRMLRRVIGEHIRLDFLPGSHLGSVYADRGMLEQVVMNLCVNARDAMPEGGDLTIETENVRIGAEYCTLHTWAKPGRYALISVSDTGCGMDSATMERIFDPFFTTKPEGRGTGLGLSTVYGIVQQHEGMVNVYSEPGKGTTFKIYLPVCERNAERVGDKIEGAVTGGTETILLVEDDESVRTLARKILEHAGYTVLTAENGEEAIAVFLNNTDRVDMLLLDVVMPRMGGHVALERMRAIRPDVPVLFSSGYTENLVHTNFVLHEGLELIQKPYARDTLLRAVRRILDSATVKQ